MREYSLLKFLSQSLDRLYLWWALKKSRAVIDPARLARRDRVNRILTINGLYDQVVPAKFTLQLWESLGRPLIRWYPCEHISFFLFPKRIVNDVVRFIQGD